MKKTIAIVLSLVLMFAFTAVTFAAEKAAAPAEKAAPATKAVKKQVTGEVTAVDAKANTLTVKGKAGDVMVSTDDKTKVMAGKDKKTLADVKVGDKVTVKYTEADGKNVANKVSITAAPAKKEAAPAEKAPAAAPAKKGAGY
jgi:Cu/Ag efflux protein CusF